MFFFPFFFSLELVIYRYGTVNVDVTITTYLDFHILSQRCWSSLTLFLQTFEDEYFEHKYFFVADDNY